MFFRNHKPKVESFEERIAGLKEHDFVPTMESSSRCMVIRDGCGAVIEDLGDGKTPPIEHFAKGLDALILRLREKICANKDNKMTPADFRVHLVAHSMGGLVCRAFLQNPKLGSAEARGAVDKLLGDNLTLLLASQLPAVAIELQTQMTTSAVVGTVDGADGVRA